MPKAKVTSGTRFRAAIAPRPRLTRTRRQGADTRRPQRALGALVSRPCLCLPRNARKTSPQSSLTARPPRAKAVLPPSPPTPLSVAAAHCVRQRPNAGMPRQRRAGIIDCPSRHRCDVPAAIIPCADERARRAPPAERGKKETHDSGGLRETIVSNQHYVLWTPIFTPPSGGGSSGCASGWRCECRYGGPGRPAAHLSLEDPRP